jgi:hypothetical protein
MLLLLLDDDDAVTVIVIVVLLLVVLVVGRGGRLVAVLFFFLLPTDVVRVLVVVGRSTKRNWTSRRTARGTAVRDHRQHADFRWRRLKLGQGWRCWWSRRTIEGDRGVHDEDDDGDGASSSSRVYLVDDD